MSERQLSPMELQVLRQREVAYAENFLPSATPAEVAWAYLGLPASVADLTIVDVGGGGSALAARLLQRGANAHAVDPVYGEPLEEIQALLEQSRSYALSEMSPEAAFTFGALIDTAAQEFLQSFISHGQSRYHAGYATKLPFHNDFADAAVSLNALTLLTDENPDLIFLGTLELLRITKPGKTVRLLPVYLEDTIAGDEFIFNHMGLIEKLRQHPQVADVHIELPRQEDLPYDLEPVHRLTLVKAKK